jgi:hypothetical protein
MALLMMLLMRFIFTEYSMQKSPERRHHTHMGSSFEVRQEEVVYTSAIEAAASGGHRQDAHATEVSAFDHAY